MLFIAWTSWFSLCFLLENRNIVFLFGCLRFEKTLVYHPSAKLYFLPLLFGKTKLNLYCFFLSVRFLFPFQRSMHSHRVPQAALFPGPCLVGLDGLEPSTSRLSGARSNHLSYRPWWRWWDSNPWPPACRAGALPTELHPRVVFYLTVLQNWTTVSSLARFILTRNSYWVFLPEL